MEATLSRNLDKKNIVSNTFIYGSFRINIYILLFLYLFRYSFFELSIHHIYQGFETLHGGDRGAL